MLQALRYFPNVRNEKARVSISIGSNPSMMHSVIYSSLYPITLCSYFKNNWEINKKYLKVANSGHQRKLLKSTPFKCFSLYSQLTKKATCLLCETIKTMPKYRLNLTCHLKVHMTI